MATYEPRPYQTECVEALLKAEASGCTKGLVVMASGLGKTLTAAFYLQRILQEQPDIRVLILCHQEEILLQSKEKFRNFFGDEYSYGMFTGAYKTRRAVSFLFSTFQTMRDYRTQFAEDTFAYVIVDEAHHTPAETYQPTVDYFTPRFLLGLTATKDRSDGQDLLDIYERIIYSMDIFDGWAEGWLAPVDYRIMLDDLSKEEFEKYVGPQAGNEKVSLAQLNRTIFAPSRDEEVVASIREQTSDLDNPSMFVFCASIKHAKAMSHQFGGEAAIVHSEQSRDTNNAVLEAFRAGDIRIILSVNMLNEGIDVPATGVVVFLRSTESQTVFWQQLGRGLRISGEKRTVRVLDYVANLERISTVLEMEVTTKKRIEASPNYSPSVNKPESIVVNIPATKFHVKRVDLETILKRTEKWTSERLIVAYYDACVENGTWLSLKEFEDNKNLPSSTVLKYIEEIGTIKKLRQIIRDRHPVESSAFDNLAYTGNVPTKVLVRKYYDASVEAGHWLSAAEVANTPNLPSRTLYNGRVGGLIKTRQLAIEWFGDFKSDAIFTSVESKSDQELLKEYYDASVEAGKWLSDGEITAHPELVSSETYRSRFNGLKNMRHKVIELFGDPFSEVVIDVSITDISYEQLIRIYYDESVKAHRWLEVVDFKDNKRLPCYSLARKIVGGVAVLREKAKEMFGVPEFELLAQERKKGRDGAKIL